MSLSDLSPKVLAYLRASDVVGAAKAESGRFPRAVAVEINRELKKISTRLYQSAKAAYRRDGLKRFFAENPEKHRLYKLAGALHRLQSAKRNFERAAEENREKEE